MEPNVTVYCNLCKQYSARTLCKFKGSYSKLAPICSCALACWPALDQCNKLMWANFSRGIRPCLPALHAVAEIACTSEDYNSDLWILLWELMNAGLSGWIMKLKHFRNQFVEENMLTTGGWPSIIWQERRASGTGAPPTRASVAVLSCWLDTSSQLSTDTVVGCRG